MVGCRMETREEEEFAGRSVVITGAAGGIGIVLVQRFLTVGHACSQWIAIKMPLTVCRRNMANQPSSPL
jgi:hypothetical protein